MADNEGNAAGGEDPTSNLTESMKRLAVPFHKVHLVHQSHKKYVSSSGAVPVHQNLLKKKEEELHERARVENKDVEELVKSDAKSKQNRINEYGYYEPEDDVVAKLILNPSLRKSEASRSIGARVTVISPDERRRKKPTFKTKKRKHRMPKSMVRKMYRNAWADIINGALHRNKASVVERLARIFKMDVRTGRETKNRCKKKRNKTKHASFAKGMDPAITANQPKISEPKEGIANEGRAASNARPKKEKADEEIIPKHKRVKHDHKLNKFFKHHRKIKLAKMNENKPVLALISKVGGTAAATSKSSNFYEGGQVITASTSKNSKTTFTGELTVAEVRKKLRSARRKKNRKSTKDMLKELLDSSLFDRFRRPELVVDEIFMSDDFDDDDEPVVVDISRFTVPDKQSSTNARRKASKHERKVFRREATVLDQVSYQLGVPTTDEPSQWVVVWGAGLSLSTRKAQVVALFEPPPDQIRFYLDKPYCTLHFGTKDDAKNARDTRNGQQPISEQIIFVGHLAKEPPLEDPELLQPFIRPRPRGLTIITDFITDEDESIILEEVIRLRASDTGKDLKNRWVKHFGFEFIYDTNDVDSSKPLKDGIPGYIIPLVDRMVSAGILSRRPEQLTINGYKPGQGIPPHVDTHSAFETPIVSLSLWADTLIDFINGEDQCEIVLPRKSLLVMDGPSRYQWKHGIAGRTFDIIPDTQYDGVTTQLRKERISLTFRLLRSSRECFCMFPELCDTQRGKITKDIAAKLEKELVHQVYEEIASHFSSTRRTPWPKVKDFVQNIAPGHALLDVGCGNGKYFNLAEYIYEVGTDMSSGLLEIARNKTKVDGVQSNCMSLPFRDNSFDALICIAVLHHLCTEERRLEAVTELIRVMSPGAEGLIYVWSKDQRVQEVKSAYARQRECKNELFSVQKKCAVAKNYSFLPVHEHEADFPQKDMLVPWIKMKAGSSGGSEASEVHHRFYHVFVRGELESLLRKVSPCPRILDSYYDQGNWCVRFQKENPNRPFL